MRRSFSIMTLAILVAFTVSCTVAKISGRGALPLVLNNLPTKVEVIKHFKESKRIMFDYTSSFDVSEVLADALAGTNADAVTNLVVVVKVGVVDYLINLVTLGIAQAKTLQVEGDLVKLPGGWSKLGGKFIAQSEDLNELLKKHSIDSSTMIVKDTTSGKITYKLVAF